MKLIFVAGTFALIDQSLSLYIAPPGSDPSTWPDDNPISPVDVPGGFGLLGGVSADQKCNKNCKNALKEAINHHNQNSDIFPVEVTELCGDLTVKTFPKFYTTQVVAGEKYNFKNFVLAGKNCDDFHVESFEVVEQPWEKVQWKWPYFQSEFIDVITAIDGQPIANGPVIAFEGPPQDISGGVSSDQECNKSCKNALKQAIKHHNKNSGIFPLEVTELCGNLKVKSFPKSYTTQIVAGTKYVFKNLVLTGKNCNDFEVKSFEVVEGWGDAPWKWASFESEFIDNVTAIDG